VPYPNEHSCRLQDPDQYQEFRRVNNDRKSGGKPIHVIYGIKSKDGKRTSEEQAYRYPTRNWNEGEAKSHCQEHDGSFEAAKKGKEGVTTKIFDILTAPWSIIPEKLLEIQEIYRTHLRGEKIDINKIEAKTGESLSDEGERYEIVNDIAIIPAYGIIAKRMNLFTRISGGVSTQLLTRDVAEALADNSIKGLILDIDSPGGTVDGTQELSSLIYKNRRQKPIAVFSDGVLASAAYWIGSAGHEIWISSDTVQTGSIGVVATHVDRSEYEKKLGFKTTEIYSGKYKRIASEYQPLSKEGKEYLQGEVDYLYSVFVNDVARNRNVDVDHVIKQMADGKVFIGRQALSNGLVDGVSTMPELIDRMTAGDVVMVPPKAHIQKEDRIMDVNVKILQEEHPEVFKEIHDAAYAEGLKTGKEAELERIKSVEEQLVPGHEELIAALKFDGKTTGAEAAVKIIAAEKVMRDKKLEEIREDAIEPVAHANSPEVEIAKGEPSFMQLVEEYMKDADCSKAAAIREMAKKHPEAHKKYIEEVNK